MKSAAVSERGPILLWESLGSAILRNLPSHGTAIGREARGIAEEVVEDLDASAATAVTVWRTVLDVADGEAAALIVLGSRGRSGVKSMVLGSVSYGVVHNSERPVLIVPPLPEGSPSPARS